MNEPSSLEAISVIDDDPALADLLAGILRANRFHVDRFGRASDFLSWLDEPSSRCDLIVSDLSMPEINGIELCRRVRARPGAERVPIILITGGASAEEKTIGTEAGADDFIQKPFSSRQLLAKIRSLLEIRAQEMVYLSELALLKERNSTLSSYLAREAQRTRRLGNLKRFVSPKVADLLTSDSSDSVLSPHRAEVTVMFVDVRRFTSFAERAHPEQVLAVLQTYYKAVGEASLRHKGTVGHLAGDGIMIFLNDPEPVERHPEMGIRMALEVRADLETLKEKWNEAGFDLDFGIGLAEGAASIGGLGFDRFWHYSVIGTVTNLAARLCQIADQGEILVSHRFLCHAGEDAFEVTELGNRTLKGLGEPVRVVNITAARR